MEEGVTQRVADRLGNTAMQASLLRDVSDAGGGGWVERPFGDGHWPSGGFTEPERVAFRTAVDAALDEIHSDQTDS